MQGIELPVGESKQVTIAADRGWQPTGIVLNGTYDIKAEGRFQVNDQPEPWLSEPDGVSVKYVRGERLGCLLGTTYSASSPRAFNDAFRIGTATTVNNQKGTLFLRLNEAMNSLANNKGQVAVTITRTK